MVLKKILLLTAASIFLSTSSWAEDVVVLRLSHEAPETAIKGLTAKVFADKVSELSNGSLRIDVYPGGQLIPTKDEVRSAIRGQVDIIAPQTNYYVPIEPGWDVFYQPVLFDSAQDGMAALHGEVGKELLDRMSRVGLHGLGTWQAGPGYLLVKKDPVNMPEEAKDRKIGLFPSAPLEEGVRLAHAVPVSIPGTDMYMSLQQGIVNGVITTVTFAAPSRWYEVLKGATRMTMFVGGYGITINQNSWDNLSDEHKDVLNKAMDYSEKWNYDYVSQNVIDSEKTLEDNGVDIIDLTPEALAAWREVVAPVYEHQPDTVKALIKQVQDSYQK